MSITINYCYRCGRKIGRSQEHCYFCTAPVRRVIREKPRCPYCAEEIQEAATKCPHCKEYLTEEKKPRTCPYCGETIKTEAIKCPHCREHLIEQAEAIPAAKQAPAKPPPNFIFVVDRALTGADQPLLIPAGEHVGGELAEKLSLPTRKAIAQGAPQQIDTPGVKALPPAEAKALVPANHFDLAPVSAPDNLPAPIANDSQAAETPMVIDVEQKAHLPATKDSLPKRLPMIILRALGRLILNVAKSSVQLLGYAAKTKKVEVSEAPPVYRNCPRCETEIFTSDNFCFHCGLALTKRRERRGKRLKAMKRSNAAVDAAILLLFGAYFVARYFQTSAGIKLTPIPFGILVTAAVLGVIGIIRRPGISSLLWGVAAGAAAYLIHLNFPA